MIRSALGRAFDTTIDTIQWIRGLATLTDSYPKWGTPPEAPIPPEASTPLKTNGPIYVEVRLVRDGQILAMTGLSPADQPLTYSYDAGHERLRVGGNRVLGGFALHYQPAVYRIPFGSGPTGRTDQ